MKKNDSNHELSDEEREKFEVMQNGGGSSNDSNNVYNSNSPTIDINQVLYFIENELNEKDLAKIKNSLAIREENVENNFQNIVEEDNLDENNNLNENQEEVIDENNIQSNEESKKELDDEEEEFESPGPITTYYAEHYEEGDEEHKEELEQEGGERVDSEEMEFVESDSEGSEVEIEDMQVSTVSTESSNDDEDEREDPPIFSVVHDELMEIFEQGHVVLLKEEFTFPTLGSRETLAFGIYNLDLSDIKDQSHWFVQKLKQFSRLKECKLLLSEENEKDLILEVGSKHAILICFKTTNLISNEFNFNREWE